MLPDSLPGLAVRLDQLLRVVVDRTAHPSAARQFRAAAAGLTPARHGAVGMFGEAPATPHPHYAYGLGGISTQQFARDLFAAGYSGSLYTLTGRASDYLIEFVYGPYGGGLALGFNAARSFPGGRGAEESP